MTAWTRRRAKSTAPDDAARSLSLRRRMIGALALVLAGVQCATALIVVVNARVATRQEVSRGMAAAEHLVREAAARMVANQGDLAGFLDTLARGSMPMRHVVITAADLRQAVPGASPEPLVTPALGAPARAQDAEAAPDWFYDLIAPDREERQIALNSAAQKIAVITVASRAQDEVDEVWADFLSLMSLGWGGSAVAILVLWLVLGRVLRPLTHLTGALRRLEEADYAARLVPVGTTEIDAVIQRFNSLAGALAAARGENERLARRLVSIQDDERRHLAMELHDEVGPCLFGIKANADSLANLADEVPPPHRDRIRQRADQIGSVIDDLQAVNRSILKRLRPIALGHVALEDLLNDLVGTTRRIAPEVEIRLAVEAARRRFGDDVDLTVYRCVQEGLANALRHGAPRRIDIRIAPTREGIVLDIADDGSGRDPAASYGLGLTGMDERVRALGGTLAVATGTAGGTRLTVRIPVAPPSETETAALRRSAAE